MYPNNENSLDTLDVEDVAYQNKRRWRVQQKEETLAGTPIFVVLVEARRLLLYVAICRTETMGGLASSVLFN